MREHVPWALAALALLLIASASLGPSSPDTRRNPRTGKPIVERHGGPISEEQLRELVLRHGFRDIEKAVAIATRESARFPNILVDTRGMTPAELRVYWGKQAAPELSVGLFQINLLANSALVPGEDINQKVDALRDPETNAAVALALSGGGKNWTPWGG